MTVLNCWDVEKDFLKRVFPFHKREWKNWNFRQPKIEIIRDWVKTLNTKRIRSRAQGEELNMNVNQINAKLLKWSMLFEHIEIQQLLVSQMTVMILTINLLILSWHCDLMSGVRKLFQLGQLGQLGQVGRLLSAHILKVFKRTNKVFYSNNSFYFRQPRRLNKTRQSSEFFFLIFHRTSSNGLVEWRDAQLQIFMI